MAGLLTFYFFPIEKIILTKYPYRFGVKTALFSTQNVCFILLTAQNSREILRHKDVHIIDRSCSLKIRKVSVIRLFFVPIVTVNRSRLFCKRNFYCKGVHTHLILWISHTTYNSWRFNPSNKLHSQKINT